MNHLIVNGRCLAPVVTPEDLRAAVVAAANHQAEIGYLADRAPVVDMRTRQVIA